MFSPRAEHAPPAERVDDQRRADLAAVGVRRRRRCARARPWRSRTSNVALVGEQPAQRAVVERRERPRQVVADGRVRGVDDELAERLLERVLQAASPQPAGRDPARRGLALADLVAVDHHHVGAAAGQLARRPRGRRSSRRRSGRRSRDRAGSARRRAWWLAWHGRRMIRAPCASRIARSACGLRPRREPGPHAACGYPPMTHVFNHNPDPPDQSNAKVVEGSDGLLLEIDGQIVPNYDATLHPFQEGDVVTGHVVRIDNDEVLVDIGYKSEGVIPASELSIRKSVDPGDEVSPRRRGRRARPHQGGPGRPADPVQEARPLREGLAPHRGRGRVRRARRGRRDRGRQGRPDHRPRRARLPARLAGRHPPRAEPRRVHGPDDRVQGDRAQPLAQQRRAVAPRGARGAAQGGPRADPRPAAARPGRGGHDLEHRRLRRVRRPRRDRRPDPHLRAFVVARQPPVRDPQHRRHGQRSRCSTSTASASGSRWVSSRPRRTRGSASSTPTTSATSSRARSPRSSRSARSSRSSTASRAWSTSPSSPSTTSRTRARSSSRATRCGSRSSRSTPSAGACRCRSSASRARCCRSGRSAAPTDGDAGELDDVPELGLSEDVFASTDLTDDGAAASTSRAESRRRTDGGATPAWPRQARWRRGRGRRRG